MPRITSGESLNPGMISVTTEPETHGVQTNNRIQNVFQDAVEFPVIAVLKAFQIQLVEIYREPHEFEYLGCCVAVRNKRRLKVCLSRFLEYLYSPLAGDQRFVVSAGSVGSLSGGEAVAFPSTTHKGRYVQSFSYRAPTQERPRILGFRAHADRWQDPGMPEHLKEAEAEFGSLDGSAEFAVGHWFFVGGSPAPIG